MTLTYYKDNSELFASCVLWWQGRDQTSLGFPILPTGVTVTPNGTWANDLNLGNNKSVKTFDGSTNYISLLYNISFAIGQSNTSFTIGFWINAQSGQQAVYLYLFGGSDAWNTTNGIYYMLFTTATATYFRVFNISPYYVDVTIDRNVIATGEWEYVTIMYNGTTTTLYINGSYISSNAITYKKPTTLTYLYIGGKNATNYFMNGNIKDLMIYKGRALTQPEIIEIMRLTNPASGRDFAAIYPGVRSCE